ncbi:helix-turn-helix domain-containing protein [Hymenobacter cellulosivorans]|uniref:AraC family transcriptional regulator n=1 Tax=Hymenobacter cellulosivorans TaxID=2932249 RepID=A0ABY4F6B4_9BACT|nr:AraC family transcriptional regulator [Hymenobacter cellulosivorans]UOQ51751.1 AraC family transcriptional regulator [Hymenobacter cellulosivorans]
MFPTYHLHDFPSDNALPGQVLIERVEQLQRPASYQWPHRRSFYEILWLTEGSATNVVDYHETTIEPQTLFFVGPGQLHLLSQTTGVKGYSIAFTEIFLLQYVSQQDVVLRLAFLANSATSAVLKMDEEALHELEPVLALLKEEAGRPEKSAALLGHLLFILLNRIQRLITCPYSSRQDLASMLLVRRFRSLVEQHFRTPHSLSFYAEQLALTVHRVNEVCKYMTGKTAGDILRDRRLLEAKQQLVHSDTPIGQIAEDLGFQDFSYFSRQFKKNTQVRPAAYRREMHEKYHRAAFSSLAEAARLRIA